METAARAWRSRGSMAGTTGADGMRGELLEGVGWSATGGGWRDGMGDGRRAVSAGDAVQRVADLLGSHRLGRQRLMQHEAFDEGVQLARGDGVEVQLEGAAAAPHPRLGDRTERGPAGCCDVQLDRQHQLTL